MDPNLPAFVMNDARHIVDQLLQGTPNAVANVMGRATDRVFDRLLGKRLDDRIDGIEEHIGRIETTFSVTVSELRILLSESLAGHERLEREVKEPAAHSFIVDSIEAALETPDEAKQMLLGELIAKRLTTATESDAELGLRQAQRIVRDCSTKHLLALARVLLVTDPPFVYERPLSMSQVQEFFDAVDAATSKVEINYGDLRYLVALGATTELPVDPIHQGASPWTNLFMAWQIGIYGKEALALETRAQNIRNNTTATGFEYANGVAYRSYKLTPPGVLIASRVAARIAKAEIQA